MTPDELRQVVDAVHKVTGRAHEAILENYFNSNLAAVYATE